METKNVVAASIIGVAAVSFIGWQVLNDKDDKKVDDKKAVPVADNNDSNTTTSLPSYKDGEYNSEGTYMAPPGQETIKVALKISNGVIESADVSPITVSKDSLFYFDLFQKGFSSEVVGKNIDEVKLTVVNGSSLTSGGFNDALSAIKQQAKQ